MLDSTEKQAIIPRNGSSCCPCRFVLTLFLFSGLLLAYALRFSLSVALVAMVNSTAIAAIGGATADEGNLTTCHVEQPLEGREHARKEGPFPWSPGTQGLVLGAFFYGYTLTQIPGAFLAERFGGKWPFGLGLLCTATMTLLTPMAAKAGAHVLVAVRVIEGLGEGVTYPAMFSMVGRWAPPHERGSLLAVAYIGSNVGAILGMPLTALFCDTPGLGWEPAFYVFGAVGCAYFVMYAWRVRSDPHGDPWISDAELEYISRCRETLGPEDPKIQRVPTRPGPTPWGAILRSGPLLALTLSRFSSLWGQFTVLTGLPTYMTSVIHLPLGKNGLVNSVIFSAQSVGMLIGGFLGDHFRKKSYMPTTAIRKLFQTVSLVGAGLVLALVPWAGCNQMAVSSLLVLAMGIYGLAAGGVTPAIVDMAPAYAGTLYGICGTISNASGFLAPLVVGVITTPVPSLANWSVVFYLTSAIYLCGALVFLLFGSAELQPWAKPQVTTSSLAEPTDGRFEFTTSLAESFRMF
ncbi:sialin [Ixodes scapularis]|uniref:sialin n=1 Tax=Ixodes scapularis TaxID=6945 RepID=UPI001A9D45A2|nr:sialin [Ixodes scapularis]